MNAAATLSEVVYKAIFPPEGAIPLKAKRNIQAIDARIKEIEELATGKAIEGMTRRISSRSESLSLTEQIVQLRDSCSPPMSYREIMKRLGHVITPDAARNRYDDFKQKLLKAEAYSAMSGIPQKTETPDHIVEPNDMVSDRRALDTEIVRQLDQRADDMIELKPVEKAELAQADNTSPGQQEQPDQNPTIRESQTVENDNNTYAVTRETSALDSANGPKIPHSEDDFIIAQRESGQKFADILAALQKKGTRCNYKDVENRYYIECRRRRKSENSEPLPSTEKPRSDIVALSRQELDEWIWKLWKGGMKPDRISEKLVEEGYQYSEASVRRRLLQQGADL